MKRPHDEQPWYEPPRTLVDAVESVQSVMAEEALQHVRKVMASSEYLNSATRFASIADVVRTTDDAGRSMVRAMEKFVRALDRRAL
jgi:hypothetical protein